MRKKYVKKPDHSKKIMTNVEISREDWREKNNTLKDKAKRQGLVGCFSDGVPPWMKRMCNKRHRRLEKYYIFKGEDCKLPTKGKPKNIFDPWMWF